MSDVKEAFEAKTEFNFTLVTPISYSKGSDQLEATFILLKAPTTRNSRECAALKQAFFRAIPDTGKDEKPAKKEEKPPEIDGSEIIIMMAMSDRVDLADTMETARKLFSSGAGIALVDGEEKLTSTLIDRMSQDDFEQMTGAYLANFTLASALWKMRET